MGLLFLFGVTLAAGMFFILLDLLRLPVNLGKRQESDIV